MTGSTPKWNSIGKSKRSSRLMRTPWYFENKMASIIAFCSLTLPASSARSPVGIPRSTPRSSTWRTRAPQVGHEILDAAVWAVIGEPVYCTMLPDELKYQVEGYELFERTIVARVR